MKNLIQIVGPSFTNYSLARVNRGLALALKEVQKDYDVVLVSNNEYAERDPDKSDFNAFPEIKDMLRTEIDPEGIVIYNNFPRDPNSSHQIVNIDAEVKLVYMAWEESIYPEKWIKELNEHAHGVICSSSFVQEILTKCGLRIPTFVGLNAIDARVFNYQSEEKYPLKTSKQFKFLHISSGYPRKGTEVLIKAYSEEFSSEDNVCLVIKSLPHGLNQTPMWVEEAKEKSNAPEFELINTDISDEALASLFNATNASVYPTRAEGFGLPIAEAMHKNHPVIATGYGAHLDFMNETNGYLIDYDLVDATTSQLVNIGAKWAEPNNEHLRQLMRYLYESYNSQEVKIKLALAKESAMELTWENTAKEFMAIIPKMRKIKNLKSLSKIVITERNNKSGVAEYSRFLHRNVEHAFKSTTYLANNDIPDLVNPDEENVIRNWSTGEINFEETLKYIEHNKPDIVHIEYHSAKFKPESLHTLLEKLLGMNIAVYLTLHSASKGPSDIRKFANTLSKLQKIIVHTALEVEALKEVGLQNVELMKMGNILPLNINRSQLRERLGFKDFYPIIATHGLLNDQKGIDKLISSLNGIKEKYPNVLLVLLNAVSENNISSKSYFEEYQALAESTGNKNNTLFVDDFLDINEILALLQITDANVLAYNDIGEGASLAIQMLIAANRPMVVTDVAMFDAIKNLALVVPDNNPATLAKGIKQLIADNKEQERQVKERKQFLKQNNWFSKSVELLEKY